MCTVKSPLHPVGLTDALCDLIGCVLYHHETSFTNTSAVRFKKSLTLKRPEEEQNTFEKK